MESIRRARASDRVEWVRLRRALWPDSRADHASEIDAILRAGVEACAAFVVERRGGVGLCGLLEARLRSHADGCVSSPVAYIEGWYVEPEQQRRGLGRALVAAATEWARTLGVREIASDSALENTLGQRAHLALGFEAVGRVVQFRKRIEREG